MTKPSLKYIAFAKKAMKIQGDEIRAWVNSDNPLLAQTARETIEAAGIK